MTGRHILAVATLVALVSTAWAQDQGLRRAAIYRNDAPGFSLVPPAFEATSDAPVVMLVVFSGPPEDGFSANLNVVVQKSKLDAVIKASDVQFKALGFEVVSKKERKVESHLACEYVYQGSLEGRRLKFIALAVENGDRVFLLTGTALEKRFDACEPLFRQALSSFKFDK